MRKWNNHRRPSTKTSPFAYEKWLSNNQVSLLNRTQQINMFNSQMNVNMMSLKLITTEISLSSERIERRLQRETQAHFALKSSLKILKDR